MDRRLKVDSKYLFMAAFAFLFCWSRHGATTLNDSKSTLYLVTLWNCFVRVFGAGRRPYVQLLPVFGFRRNDHLGRGSQHEFVAFCNWAGFGRFACRLGV